MRWSHGIWYLLIFHCGLMSGEIIAVKKGLQVCSDGVMVCEEHNTGK